LFVSLAAALILRLTALFLHCLTALLLHRFSLAGLLFGAGFGLGLTALLLHRFALAGLLFGAGFGFGLTALLLHRFALAGLLFGAGLGFGLAALLFHRFALAGELFGAGFGFGSAALEFGGLALAGKLFGAGFGFRFAALKFGGLALLIGLLPCVGLPGLALLTALVFHGNAGCLRRFGFTGCGFRPAGSVRLAARLLFGTPALLIEGFPLFGGLCFAGFQSTPPIFDGRTGDGGIFGGGRRLVSAGLAFEAQFFEFRAPRLQLFTGLRQPYRFMAGGRGSRIPCCRRFVRFRRRHVAHDLPSRLAPGPEFGEFLAGHR
jgi:hypothetical protein